MGTKVVTMPGDKKDFKWARTDGDTGPIAHYEDPEEDGQQDKPQKQESEAEQITLKQVATAQQAEPQAESKPNEKRMTSEEWAAFNQAAGAEYMHIPEPDELPFDSDI